MTSVMELKDDCSLEGKVSRTNLDRVLKNKDITLPTKAKLWFFQ